MMTKWVNADINKLDLRELTQEDGMKEWMKEL